MSGGEILDDPGVEELRRRAGACSEALAGLASLEPEVGAFRRDYLDGRLLSPVEARTFCRSGLLAFMPLNRLREAGVPLVGHTVVESSEKRTVRESAVVQIQLSFVVDPGRVELSTELSVSPETTVQDGERTALAAGYTKVMVRFPGEAMMDVRVAYPGSVLSDLSAEARRLTTHYPWHDGWANWFILTGEPPPVSALKTGLRLHLVSGMDYGTITIEVAPWVSSGDVEKAYRRAQARYLVTTRKSDRDMGERSLDVFRFICKRAPEFLAKGTRTRKQSEAADWKTLLKEWNESADPAQRFLGKNALQAGFWRAFTRWRDLLFPAFRELHLNKTDDETGDKP